MDKVNDYLKKHQVFIETPCGAEMPKPVKRIRCKDGYEISVQANRTAYCEPREDKAWPYNSVELGFPNEIDSLITKYAEDTNAQMDTIYAYVPIDVVNELIDKHDGIDEQCL